MVWGANMSGKAISAVAFLLLVGVLSLFLSCSSAERENVEPEALPTSTTPIFTGGPRISFVQDFIDLGKAIPNQQLHAEFHFQNVGDAPLVIYDTTKESLEGC